MCGVVGGWVRVGGVVWGGGEEVAVGVLGAEVGVGGVVLGEEVRVVGSEGENGGQGERGGGSVGMSR